MEGEERQGSQGQTHDARGRGRPAGRPLIYMFYSSRPTLPACSLPPLPPGQHTPLPSPSLLYSSTAPSCSTPDPPTGTHTSRQTARPPLQFTISLQTPTKRPANPPAHAPFAARGSQAHHRPLLVCSVVVFGVLVSPCNSRSVSPSFFLVAGS